MTNIALKNLLTRRSVVANKLGDPGPNDDELQTILEIATRVPDHKKLQPWRLVVFKGDARNKFGDVLAQAVQIKDSPVSEDRLQTERSRFMRAPVVIGVLMHYQDKPGVPEWEQALSTGAVCQNILHAANAMNYAAQWLTEWYSYSRDVQTALGVQDNERIAGFVYIGTASEPPKERTRPDLSEVVTDWTS